MALILEFDDTNAYLSYIFFFSLGLGPGFVFLGILSHLQYPQSRWNARDTCELMSFLPPKKRSLLFDLRGVKDGWFHGSEPMVVLLEEIRLTTWDVYMKPCNYISYIMG